MSRIHQREALGSAWEFAKIVDPGITIAHPVIGGATTLKTDRALENFPSRTPDSG